MRLCDRDIEAYIDAGKIQITPRPTPDMISGVSVDIRLGHNSALSVVMPLPFIDLSGPREEVDLALNSVMSDEIVLTDDEAFSCTRANWLWLLRSNPSLCLRT